MILGIEIGGTKLQLGVGDGHSTEFKAFERRFVDREKGHAAILEEIKLIGGDLFKRFDITKIGIGFGGPLRAHMGIVTRSHQIQGWDNFPLSNWCEKVFGIKSGVVNDCDAAAFGEAMLGSGRSAKSVLYVTVGTGVGGGLILDEKIFGLSRPAAVEVGQLKIGTGSQFETVEYFASGPGMVRTALQLSQKSEALHQYSNEIIALNRDRNLTGKSLGQLAIQGNKIALEAIQKGVETLGWGVAQTITITSPQVVILGGGISLLPANLFIDPLQRILQELTFNVLQPSYVLKTAMLGENSVVHGAIQVARMGLPPDNVLS